MLQYIHLNHYIASLLISFSSAQINFYDVVDDDTTNTVETSTMTAGNIVAYYFWKFNQYGDLKATLYH